MGSLDFFGGNRDNDLVCTECEDLDTCPDVFAAPTRQQCAFRQEVDIEDNNLVLMELEGGIKAAYLQCHFTPDYVRNYCFIGTKGRMECVDADGPITVLTRRGNEPLKLANRTYTVKPAEGGHGGADPVIAGDFVNMLLTGKEPVATPLAGRMSVAVGVRAAESLRNGSIPLEVPPPPEFAG